LAGGLGAFINVLFFVTVNGVNSLSDMAFGSK